MYQTKFFSVTLCVLFVILFSAGCSNKTAYQTNTVTADKFTVNLANLSDAPISEIQYQSQNEGGGVINADGSLLEREDTFQIIFDYPKKNIQISILDDEKEILLFETIKLEFNSRDIMNLKIIDDGEGIDLINSN